MLSKNIVVCSFVFFLAHLYAMDNVHNAPEQSQSKEITPSMVVWDGTPPEENNFLNQLPADLLHIIARMALPIRASQKGGKLHVLDLSNKGITSLHDFAAIIGLLKSDWHLRATVDTLDLSNNNISILNGNSFAGCSGLFSHINLAHNKLTQLNSKSFAQLEPKNPRIMVIIENNQTITNPLKECICNSDVVISVHPNYSNIQKIVFAAYKAIWHAFTHLDLTGNPLNIIDSKQSYEGLTFGNHPSLQSLKLPVDDHELAYLNSRKNLGYPIDYENNRVYEQIIYSKYWALLNHIFFERERNARKFILFIERDGVKTNEFYCPPANKGLACLYYKCSDDFLSQDNPSYSIFMNPNNSENM